MEESTIHSIQAFIKAVVADSKICKLDLGFFGGEPILYFAKIAKPIIEFAKNICKEFNKDLRVHFTSNAALLTDKIIDYLSQCDCGFQITLDGSKETHDRTRCFKNGLGSYDIIVRNVRKLLSRNISVIVRVNYTSANVDNVAAIEKSFDGLDEHSKKKLCFDFQRVWQDNGDKDDETDVKIKRIRTSFRAAGFSVLANYLSRNIRESCYGDKTNYALINYNGEVFGCTARDFIHANKIGILETTGTIVYDEEKYQRRNQSKFSKAICKQCRIAPLCGGGCRQRALETADSPDCSMGYSDRDIDRIITDIFEHQFDLNT